MEDLYVYVCGVENERGLVFIEKVVAAEKHANDWLVEREKNTVGNTVWRPVARKYKVEQP